LVQTHWKNLLLALLKYTDHETGEESLRILVWDLYVPSHNSFIMTIQVEDSIHIDDDTIFIKAETE
jgi:hypothetical protein